MQAIRRFPSLSAGEQYIVLSWTSGKSCARTAPKLAFAFAISLNQYKTCAQLGQRLSSMRGWVNYLAR